MCYHMYDGCILYVNPSLNQVLHDMCYNICFCRAGVLLFPFLFFFFFPFLQRVLVSLSPKLEVKLNVTVVFVHPYLVVHFPFRFKLRLLAAFVIVFFWLFHSKL